VTHPGRHRHAISANSSMLEVRAGYGLVRYFESHFCPTRVGNLTLDDEGVWRMRRESNKMESRPTTVLLVGYAKLPEETAAQSLYGSVGVALELERETGTILAASCTLVLPMASDFISKILKGKKLPEELEEVVAEICARYLGPAQNAIVAALRAANDRWEGYRAGDI